MQHPAIRIGSYALVAAGLIAVCLIAVSHGIGALWAFFVPFQALSRIQYALRSPVIEPEIPRLFDPTAQAKPLHSDHWGTSGLQR